MAQDYDNTDRGAAFKPFDTQKLILQGKLNNAGVDRKVVLVKDQTKSGTNLIEIFEKVGVLFENDKKGNENAPDYTGLFEAGLDERRVAAWRKMKDSNPYMTMQISDKQKKESQDERDSFDRSLDNDQIPF